VNHFDDIILRINIRLTFGEEWMEYSIASIKKIKDKPLAILVVGKTIERHF
jgi:hypothetical protein